MAQDYDLWLRLADRHRLANLPDVVLHYRRHPRQVSVQALEQQVLSSLAAQAAARRRRAGTEDGGNAIEDTANGTNRIAREDLAGLGVTDDAIRNALARACLHRAADLSDINEAELAVQTLAMTPGYRTSEDVRRHILARYHSFLARRRWQRGQVGGSLISALRAVRMRPSLLGRVARVPVRWSHDAPNFRMAGQETGPPPRLVESAEPDPGPDPGRAPRA